MKIREKVSEVCMWLIANRYEFIVVEGFITIKRDEGDLTIDFEGEPYAIVKLNYDTESCYNLENVIKFIKTKLGKEEIKKPVCKLIGEDGNIFNLLGIAQKALKKNDQADDAKAMSSRVWGSKSYEEALSIIGEYVEIV